MNIKIGFDKYAIKDNTVMALCGFGVIIIRLFGLSITVLNKKFARIYDEEVKNI